MNDLAMPDMSSLSDADIVMLCYQRSSKLGPMNPPRRRAAGSDYGKQMMQFVTERRDQILKTVFDEIVEEFNTLTTVLDVMSPRRIVDIGSGYAFVDLLLHRRYESDLVLVDIESTETLHFGFEATGAGYSDLDAARRFLVANGVPERAIATINPARQAVGQIEPVDVAISLISCGFHYPVSTYAEFFRSNVRKAIILDIRKGSGGLKELKKLGDLEILKQGQKHRQVCCHMV